MAICLDLLLVADRYDAGGGQDPRSDEWPPHPGRVQSALRSVATDDDLPTLRALERLLPPIVHASDLAGLGRSRTYVVTNTIRGEGGNLNHPGRTSGLRERRSVFPLNPRVQMVWRDDDALGDDDVQRLDAMARRVPYLGRSTSPVLMGIKRTDEVRVPVGLEAFEPAEEGEFELRVPYPGYVDELNALHAEGRSAWQASEGARARQTYRRVEEAVPGEKPVFLSPYRDLVPLRFVDRSPAGRETPVFAAALRSMVMRQTADPLPPALHGHGYDGNPHVAYLGLPFCGSPHADGRLVALGVAIPGMDEEERKRVLRGLLGPGAEGKIELDVPGYREPFHLEYQPNERLPRSASAWHWTRSSRKWVTATPIVLDRYPKNGDLAEAVLRSVVLAGLPEPVLVEASTEALTTGAVRLSPRELPRRALGRLYCHARITFDQPVSGPVLVGAGRYFGVGLLQPERHRGGDSDEA